MLILYMVQRVSDLWLMNRKAAALVPRSDLPPVILATIAGLTPKCQGNVPLSSYPARSS